MGTKSKAYRQHLVEKQDWTVPMGAIGYDTGASAALAVASSERGSYSLRALLNDCKQEA